MIKLEYLKRKDIISISLIIGSTVLYCILSYIPRDFITIDLYFFKIGTFGFPDIAHLGGFLKMKILILSFSLIWYFTCIHWWRSAILVIIAIELAKLVSALNSAHIVLDEIDYITSLPITITIIIIFISIKLNTYNLSIDLRTQVDNEIDVVFNELEFIKTDDLLLLKERYDVLKTFKHDLNEKEYLKQLIAIRDQFYKNSLF
jgi:hypothetical protein